MGTETVVQLESAPSEPKDFESLWDAFVAYLAEHQPVLHVGREMNRQDMDELKDQLAEYFASYLRDHRRIDELTITRLQSEYYTYIDQHEQQLIDLATQGQIGGSAPAIQHWLDRWNAVRLSEHGAPKPKPAPPSKIRGRPVATRAGTPRRD